jgi:hypothetical protein
MRPKRHRMPLGEHHRPTYIRRLLALLKDHEPIPGHRRRVKIRHLHPCLTGWGGPCDCDPEIEIAPRQEDAG